MNSKALFRKALESLTLDDREEATSILYRVFEHLFKITRTDILSEKSLTISDDQQNSLENIIVRLNTHEPLQYVLGFEFFYSRIFYVDRSVLIPRPETEELIHVVKAFAQNRPTPISVLDVGTGSGCIPITLALEITESKVFAIDISEEALNTAKKNSDLHKTDVLFQRLDILNEKIPFQNLDVIVSNPPYIALEERDAMNKNVVDYEPHIALFVSDSNPLTFYQQIAEKSKEALKPGGLLAVEINERFGSEVAELLMKNGFSDVVIIKDLSGKDRIVKGIMKQLI